MGGQTQGRALDGFLDALCGHPALPAVFRPWSDCTPGIDAGPDAPLRRLANLRAYLTARLERAEVVLVAEAVGYQGGRFSGIPMTCERTLLGAKPDVPPDAVFPGEKRRTSALTAARSATERSGGFCEPTATIVWTTMLGLGLTGDRFALWNTFAFHPHKPNQPLTNRTPTDREVADQAHILDAFLALFPGRPVIAVGETARRRMAVHGVAAQPVRHPAYGGATAFRDGVRRIMGMAG